MGIMNDINEALRMAAKAKALKQKVNHKSIAASAQDSIFQFPCLISNTVPVDMSMSITQMLDRTYASFVQIVLSNVGNVDMSIDPNPTSFLASKVHQNMRLESASDDEKVLYDSFYEGGTVIAWNPIRGLAMCFNAYEGAHSKNIRELNFEACKEFMSDFDLVPIMEAPEDDDRSQIAEELLNSSIRNQNLRASQNAQKLVADIGRNKRGPELLDRDVKKSNAMQPYAISVRLSVVNENHEFVDYWDVVVGVKTILHLIKSDEMIENIAKAVQNRSVLFNFLRWTTGEISFVKDLLLHIDDIKFDVRNMDKGYSRWFPTLKRIKDRKINFRNITPTMNVPTATVVISSYEVDELEKRFGIIIKDVAVANKVMDGLNLMGFVIVDDASQTIEVLFNDGGVRHGNSFETYAMETITREVSSNRNSSAMVRELGRMFGSSY